MDIIFIRELRIETVIGVNDWERRTTQWVNLDLEMGWDTSAAAEEDDIGRTLDYKAVAKRLMELVGQSRARLVEHLAERCARAVMEEFGVPWLRLTLSKPAAVRGSRAVGVVIERGSRP